jgi:hypothetical protein
MEKGGRRREVVGRLEVGCYLDISYESQGAVYLEEGSGIGG